MTAEIKTNPNLLTVNYLLYGRILDLQLSPTPPLDAEVTRLWGIEEEKRRTPNEERKQKHSFNSVSFSAQDCL